MLTFITMFMWGIDNHLSRYAHHKLVVLHVYKYTHTPPFSQSTDTASVTCTNQYINPRELVVESDLNSDEERDPTVNMGNGRRKKRSTVKRTLRNKRQDVAPQVEKDMSENITYVSLEYSRQNHTSL